MEYSLFDEKVINDLIICGTDEAGRGPLAGPVVAAAVVLPKDFPINLLNDSKKMKEKDRIEIEAMIKEKAVAYSVAVIDHETIDKINILKASLLGMKNSYEAVSKMVHVDMLLCDGNKTPDVSCPVEAIVKGDAKIPEIMAASILAKNERDRIMDEYAKIYPGYGFEKHKGYPTKAHYDAIEKLGVTDIHRKTFRLFKTTKPQEEQTLF